MSLKNGIIYPFVKLYYNYHFFAMMNILYNTTFSLVIILISITNDK